MAQNISEMVRSGHPRKQAIAAALSTARKYGEPSKKKRGGIVLDQALREAQKYAKGGALDEAGLGQVENHIPHPSGMLNSAVPGRTDKLPISVKAGSYVVPADTISALGDSNSLAGRKAMEFLIAHATQGAQLGTGAPAGPPIPIIAAGGEYVVDPVAVAHIGGGSLKKGHDTLDRFVREIRRLNIRTLRNLPSPRVD